MKEDGEAQLGYRDTYVYILFFLYVFLLCIYTSHTVHTYTHTINWIQVNLLLLCLMELIRSEHHKLIKLESTECILRRTMSLSPA